MTSYQFLYFFLRGLLGIQDHTVQHVCIKFSLSDDIFFRSSPGFTHSSLILFFHFNVWRLSGIFSCEEFSSFVFSSDPSLFHKFPLQMSRLLVISSTILGIRYNYFSSVFSGSFILLYLRLYTDRIFFRVFSFRK